MLRQPLFFWSGCLSIQFFNLPLLNTVRPRMATYPSLCSPVWLSGCHATPLFTRCFPTTLSSLTLPWTIAGFLHLFYSFSPAQRRVIRDLPHHPFFPRKTEDFPRGDKHLKHIPLPTYLIYLSPKDLYR